MDSCPDTRNAHYPGDIRCGHLRQSPRWIKKVDVIILNEAHPDYATAWTRLLKQLNDPPERTPRPFTVPNPPEHFVERPQRFDELIHHLLDDSEQNPVAITTALQGGGGFGKTTLAIALCHDEHVRVAFDDGILWLQFRDHMTDAQVLRLLNEQIQLLALDDSSRAEITTAAARFRELLADKDMLVVIDDAWTAAYLHHFIHGGTAYLITTRLQTVVTLEKATSVFVDDMETDEAVRLLVNWLPDKPGADMQSALKELAERLGEWALLLELVGAEMRSLVAGGRTVQQAIDFITRRFRPEMI